MTTYICNVCSNKKNGNFRFKISWDDSSSSPSASRCPRCGALEDELMYL